MNSAHLWKVEEVPLKSLFGRGTFLDHPLFFSSGNTHCRRSHKFSCTFGFLQRLCKMISLFLYFAPDPLTGWPSLLSNMNQPVNQRTTSQASYWPEAPWKRNRAPASLHVPGVEVQRQLTLASKSRSLLASTPNDRTTTLYKTPRPGIEPGSSA